MELKEETPPEEITVTAKAELSKEDLYPVPEIEIKEKFFDFTGGKDYLDMKLTSLGILIESADKKIQKTVSYQGLLKSLSDEASLDTGLLPILGDRYIAVRRYLVRKDRHYIFVEASPQKRDIKVYDGTSNGYETIPDVSFPGLLLVLVGKEDSSGRLKLQLGNSRMFALKTPVYSEETILYTYPFTNVYDDARICWGNTINENTEFKISQSASFLELFLNAINNEDLFRRNMSPTKTGDSIHNFKAMSQVKEYPLGSLVSARNMTFRSLVKLVTEN